MFKFNYESFDDYKKRMEKRADILFPTMKSENKINKPKNLPLGKSIYDEDDDDDFPSVKNIGKIKSELEPLVEAVKKEKNTEQKSRKDRTPEEEEEFLNDFYPSMKHLGKDKVNQTDDEKSEKNKNKRNDKNSQTQEKDEKGTFTGGAADIKQNLNNTLDVQKKSDISDLNNPIKRENNRSLPEKIKEYFNNIREKHNKTPLLTTTIEKSDLKLSDQNFVKSMDVVFENEGGFNDDPDDLGGRTNMGITQKTYDDYCKRHGLEKKDVKNLTKEDAAEVYYNDYWKASGADKIDNPSGAMVVFDTAVLHGPSRAKQFYKQSRGDLEKMIELRKEYYAKRAEEKPSQKKFLKGWNNRADNLLKIMKNYSPNDD